MGESMDVNVVYSSSDLYSECTGISIMSLLSNNLEIGSLKIHILSSNISIQNKDKLKQICKQYNREVVFIEAQNDFIKAAKEYELPLLRNSYSTYSRIMLNTWFKDLKRVIVIDSDTLIQGSIYEMYCQLFSEEKCIAAVPEIAVYSKFSIVEDSEILDNIPMYYNMGIVVVDLEKWRLLELDSFLKTQISNSAKNYKVADQSIINKFLNDRITRLHLKFNCYSSVHFVSYNILRKVFNEKEVFSLEELHEAKAFPVIIHFYGHPYERPWYKKSVSKYKKKYLDYVNSSPWKDNELMPWPKYSDKVFLTYDLICYFLMKIHCYRSVFYFRYVCGQKIKSIMKRSR